jgi:hypothetical protein
MEGQWREQREGAVPQAWDAAVRARSEGTTGGPGSPLPCSGPLRRFVLLGGT